MERGDKVRFKVKNEYFSDLESALDYVVEEGLSTKDIEVCTVADETENLAEKEVPVEETAMTQEEFEELQQDNKLVENYSELDDTTKKIVLSRIAGKVTGKPHNKKFNESVKTGEAVEKAYGNVIEQLQNPNIEQCPVCGLHISQDQIFGGFNRQVISELKGEKLAKVDTKNKYLTGGASWRKANKMIKSPRQQLRDVPVSKIIEKHIRLKHKILFSELESIFNQWKQDEHGNLLPSNKKNVEHLSREELAEQIESNPELRRKFFRSWMKKPSTKSKRH